MKNNILLAVIIAVLAGFGGGYVVGSTLDTDGSDTDTSMKDDMTESHSDGDSHMDGEDMMHSHGEPFNVPADQAPFVDLMVREDAKSGWNIKINTENFTFTPDAVNGDNVIGEGHAHIYLDGEKIARVYGPDFHYSGNFDGTKTFSVTLNANDHSEYAVNGEVIEAEMTVTHDHGDEDMHSN